MIIFFILLFIFCFIFIYLFRIDFTGLLINGFTCVLLLFFSRRSWATVIVVLQVPQQIVYVVLSIILADLPEVIIAILSLLQILLLNCIRLHLFDLLLQFFTFIFILHLAVRSVHVLLELLHVRVVVILFIVIVSGVGAVLVLVE